MMKLSSFARRAAAAALPKLDASACMPPTYWTECDTIYTSSGAQKELVDCQTSCSGTTYCTPTGQPC